jgi:hypothetical protein
MPSTSAVLPAKAAETMCTGVCTRRQQENEAKATVQAM